MALLIRIATWCVDRVGDVAYWLLPHYRAAAQWNLAHVLGAPPDSAPVRGAVRAAFRYSARNYLAVALVRLSGGRWSPPVTIEQTEPITTKDILISAHLGPFDVVAQLVARRGMCLATLVATEESVIAQKVATWLRSGPGLHLWPVNQAGWRRVVRAWQRGSCHLTFLVDRDLAGRGRPILFFGRVTTLPDGPVRLARRLLCSLRPVFCYRVSHGYVIRVGQPISASRTDNREDDVERMLRLLITELEHAIRQAPDQWLVFRPIWPTEPYVQCWQ